MKSCSQKILGIKNKINIDVNEIENVLNINLEKIKKSQKSRKVFILSNSPHLDYVVRVPKLEVF